MKPILRTYQQEIVNEILAKFDQSPTVVLAASPNAGKTECGIYITTEFLEKGKKVLIIPHATTVLKSQFRERAEKYGILNHPNLKIEIPQNLKKVQEYDLVIVDEAHEWFYADSVQKILGKTKPKHTLCLTATPSEFIDRKNKGEKLEIVFKSMNELPSEFFAPLTLHLSSSDSDITKDDFSEYDELRGNYAWTKTAVESDIKELISSVLNHIKTVHKEDTGLLKRCLNSAKSLFGSFSYLQKTMIACHNVKQAHYVAKFLLNNGVNVVISDYESDTASEQVNRFKTDPSVLVLVVIRRGILGFDMPEMCAVVDMTATLNINRIYQMLCRVVRKHPNDNKKLFVKIANKNMRDYSHAVTCTALALSDRHALEMYDGNLRNAPTVEYVKREPKEEEVPRKKGTPQEKTENKKRELFDLMQVLNVPDFFEATDKSYGEGYVVYGESSLYKVRCASLGVREIDPAKKKLAIKEFYEKNGRFPSSNTLKDRGERVLGGSLATYCSKTGGLYDPEFEKWARVRGYGQGPSLRKKQLLDIARNGGERPTEATPLGPFLSDYTNKRRGQYDPEFDMEIKNLAPQWFIDTTANKKKQLLEIAKNGEPRPLKRRNFPLNKEQSIAQSLIIYTTVKSKCYDQNFADEIKKLAPHWFIDTVAENKAVLLEKAKRGDSKPKRPDRKMTNALWAYTTKRLKSYDSVFDKQIKELAPHWFIDIVAEKKNQILEIAKNREPRPHTSKHPLGHSLCSYTGKKSDCYDPEFTKQIKELAPHWFIDIVAEKKKQILEMAINGEPRPKSTHIWGRYINDYTTENRGCYDPEFTKQIKELAPHWFIDTVSENKKQLLELAGTSGSRPNQKNNSLGGVFSSYATKRSKMYDPEFTEKIKKIRPDWFITQSDVANEKKKQILEMAKNGESRPNQKNHPLGPTLSSYTGKHDSYDPEFDKQIRALRPDWFTKSKGSE